MNGERARVIKRAELDALLMRAGRANGPGEPDESDPQPDPDAPCGTVREVVGLSVHAELDTDEVAIGEVLAIERQSGTGRIRAQVVGFRAGQVMLAPLADIRGVGPASRVYRHAAALTVGCGEHLLGRVIDGLGRAIDGGPALPAGEPWAVDGPAPDPLACPPIARHLATGVRAIDGLMPLGQGQRVGLFAGPGVGKSSLLARLANHAEVDVCVLCLVGERGRDIRQFARRRLSPERRRRTVLVCARSDAPGQVRVNAAFVAAAIAEWFGVRRGARVLLLVDSLTRMARAQREVGLAAGEMPVRHGYPPSVFARLPRLVERAGPRADGSITAVYSVLTDGERGDDPLAAEVRSLVDGHIALTRERAARGQWPAIDVLASVSRAGGEVSAPEHARAAQRVRRLLALARDSAELVAMGAYQPGVDAELDAALRAAPAIDRLLCHEGPVAYRDSVARVQQLAARHPPSSDLP